MTGHLFINYLGLPGAGKTLSAVEKHIIPYYKEGRLVYSNTWLNLKGIKYFSSLDDLLDVRNAVIFIDEIGQFLDPYAWKDLSYSHRAFFQNHRKYHLDIISTTQDVSFIAKPARVLISDWVFCENNSYSPLVSRFMALFGVDEIRVKYLELKTYDLLKLQKGIGFDTLNDDVDDVDFNIDNDIDIAKLSEIKKNLNPVKKKSYSIKKLVHRELDDFKNEIYYFYCPKCGGRQYYDIKKGNEFKYFNFDKKGKYYCKMNYYCPNHRDSLLVARLSFIYDTDYLIKVSVPSLVWRPFVPSRAGERLVPYRGFLPSSVLPSSQNLAKSPKKP